MALGLKCMSAFLFFFNFLFWLSGCALLTLGVWFYTSTSAVSQVFSFLLEVDGIARESVSLSMVAIMFIAVGGFIFIVAFCGCCGVIRHSRCLLSMFITLLVVVLVAEMVAGIMAVVYRDGLLNRFKTEGINYFENLYEDNSVPDMGANIVMWKAKCCGMVGPIDFLNSAYSKNDESRASVPPFCCRQKENVKIKEDFPRTDNYDKCLSEAKQCQMKKECKNSEHTELHSTGCYDAFKVFVATHLPLFIGVACGLAALEVAGLIVSVWVCRSVDEKYY